MSYTRQEYNKRYSVWRHMMARCHNVDCKEYKWYGARGITVCSRWQSRENFWKDMDEGYMPGLTLDRIDNNKGYSKDNCRWATRKEQALNRRSNRIIEFRGTTMTIYQWAKQLGVKRTTLSQRLNAYGWSIEKAFTTPTRKRG